MADSAKQFLIVDDKGNGHLKVRQTPDGPLDHGLMGGALNVLSSASTSPEFSATWLSGG